MKYGDLIQFEQPRRWDGPCHGEGGEEHPIQEGRSGEPPPPGDLDGAEHRDEDAGEDEGVHQPRRTEQ